METIGGGWTLVASVADPTYSYSQDNNCWDTDSWFSSLKRTLGLAGCLHDNNN